MSIVLGPLCATGLALAGTTYGIAKGETGSLGNEGPPDATVVIPIAQATAAPRISSSKGEILRIPFHVRHGYIFVDGKVDGQSGVFMFDTGSPFTFLLNRDLVPLTKGDVAASGEAASGQAITVKVHRQPHTIHLAGGEVFTPAEIRSANTGFVAKGLDVPLLGFLGIGLLRDYRFTIDYRRRLITLEPRASTSSIEAEPLAVMRFHYDGHMPKLAVELGGLSIPAVLDTGQQGNAALTEGTRERLIDQGLMSISGEGDARMIDLHALHYNTLPFDLGGLDDAGEAQDRILLGYSFLRQFRSVWDYDKMTITLYAVD